MTWTPEILSPSTKGLNAIFGSKAVDSQKRILEQKERDFVDTVIAPLKATEANLATASMHVNNLLQPFKSLQSATYDLTNFASWSLYTFQDQASDGAVTITPTSTATDDILGQIEVSVTAVAQNDRIKSDTSNVFTSTTTALALSGNLVLNGSDPIAIAATDTLEDIADKIRNNTSISATIMKIDTNQYVLTLSHPDLCTPIDGSSSDTGIWTGLRLPATTAINDLRANLAVNGVAGIRRDTNTITDIIPGLKLTLSDVSTETTKGSMVANTTDFDAKLSAFVTAYNACQKAVAGERALDPSDPQKNTLLATSVLKDFSAFVHIENAMDLPIRNVSGSYTNFRTFGYSLDINGQLVVDEEFKKTNLSVQDRMSFFASTCSISGNFSQAMPMIFEKNVQANMAALHGKEITVTIENDGGTYTATLSASGLSNLSLPYDPNTGRITGTDDYEGVYLTYEGGAIASGSSVSTTLTLYQGTANMLYNTLDKVLTTYPDKPSIFDLLAQEIQDDKESVAKDIAKKMETMETQRNRVMAGSARIATLETLYEANIRLVRGVNSKKSSERG